MMPGTAITSNVAKQIVNALSVAEQITTKKLPTDR